MHAGLLEVEVPPVDLDTGAFFGAGSILNNATGMPDAEAAASVAPCPVELQAAEANNSSILVY